jgi:hypothetical protein
MPTYDPKNVALDFAAVRITGFADGSFVNVEYDADDFSHQTGADGEGVWNRGHTRSASITVQLMPTASSNAIPLMAAHAADLASNSGLLPFVLIDNMTKTSHVGLARVTKTPGRDYQKQTQPVTWVLRSGNLVTVHGAAEDVLQPGVA